MIYLSEEAIDYAIQMCVNHAGYKVIVVCSSRSRSYVKVELLSRVNVSKDINIQQSCGNLSVRWTHGSSILLFSGEGNIRGSRAHLLIIDKNISPECSYRWLPMETLGYEDFSDRTLPEFQHEYQCLWKVTIPDSDNEMICKSQEDDAENVVDISESDLMKILGDGS